MRTCPELERLNARATTMLSISEKRNRDSFVQQNVSNKASYFEKSMKRAVEVTDICKAELGRII